MAETKIKPLERGEIRKCDCCGKGLMHNSSLNVYRVRVESHVLDVNVLGRQMGLEMVFGGGSAGAVLADVMGPERSYSVPLVARDLVICFDCAVKMPAAALLGDAPPEGEQTDA
jgi:hypothetical protein